MKYLTNFKHKNMKKLLKSLGVLLLVATVMSCQSKNKDKKTTAIQENPTTGKQLYKNATLISGNGDDAKVTDFLVENGKIVKVGENLSDQEAIF